MQNIRKLGQDYANYLIGLGLIIWLSAIFFPNSLFSQQNWDWFLTVVTRILPVYGAACLILSIVTGRKLLAFFSILFLLSFFLTFAVIFSTP
ncbi:hypothetical protein [Streptococcus sp. 20-1249]|uniref:hypothetical protein n=1 Tax=Streptococcus hepaticus TaxID=3349163 RepID=UPI003748020F